jgi:hypothetical protein
MKYNPLIARLEEKYPPKQRGFGCLPVSESLALLVLAEFPGHSVSTAQTRQTSRNGAIRETNHYVSIVREPSGKLIAMDATRPSYEDGEDCWTFEAQTESELMAQLSKHYGGDWNIQDKWLHEVPEWYKGFP